MIYFSNKISKVSMQFAQSSKVSKSPVTYSTTKIYLKDISPAIIEWDLMVIFKRFDVNSTTYPAKAPTHNHRRYVFILFKNLKEVCEVSDTLEKKS